MKAPSTSTSNNASISQGETAFVTSGGGLITYNAAIDITMTSGTLTRSLNPANDTGAIALTAGRNIYLSILEADGNVSVSATAGAIYDNLLAADNGTDYNIKGTTTTVYLKAGNGIGTSGSGDIDTQIASLIHVENSTAGDIFIQEADDLLITADGITSAGSSGSMVLTLTAGSLAIDKPVANTGTVGNILFTASGNIIVSENISSRLGNISLDAGGSISQAAAVGDISISAYAIAGKTIDLKAGTFISMVNGAVAQANNNGNIRLEAVSGDITIGEIVAGSGKVAVIATAGSILDLAGDTSTYDISAADLLLTAATAIGSASDAFETAVTNISTWSKNGGTFIAEADSITVKDISLTVNRVGTSGVDALTTADSQQGMVITGGNLVFTTSNGFMTTAVTTGAISATGNILLSTGESAEVTVADITLNSSVSSSGGAISIISKDSILQSHADADISVTTAGKTIDLLADAAITMVDGAVSQTNAGYIGYTTATTTAGNITVGLLDARSAADRSGNVLTGQASWGTINILSGASILDNNETTVDVYANELLLSAITAAGASDNHLETEVITLSATVGAGGLFVTDATTITVNATSSNGNITLTATSGDITIDTLTAGTGNVSLIAGGDILDQDTAGDNGAIADITANGLVMNAGSGIATSSNYLEITVTTLTASAGSDGIFITESDSLTVGSLSTTADGHIVLVNTTGDLTINNTITAAGAGNILLQATTGAITINNAVDGGTGHISISSGASFSQNANISTTAGGAIEILSGGSIAMADGALTSSVRQHPLRSRNHHEHRRNQHHSKHQPLRKQHQRLRQRGKRHQRQRTTHNHHWHSRWQRFWRKQQPP